MPRSGPERGAIRPGKSENVHCYEPIKNGLVLIASCPARTPGPWR